MCSPTRNLRSVAQGDPLPRAPIALPRSLEFGSKWRQATRDAVGVDEIQYPASFGRYSLANVVFPDPFGPAMSKHRGLRFFGLSALATLPSPSEAVRVYALAPTRRTTREIPA